MKSLICDPLAGPGKDEMQTIEIPEPTIEDQLI
jgi:hypothetical protein